MPIQLKGAIVEWVEHDKTKRRAPIRLDKRNMTFFAREDDTDFRKEPFQSKDGGEVRRWLKHRLALAALGHLGHRGLGHHRVVAHPSLP